MPVILANVEIILLVALILVWFIMIVIVVSRFKKCPADKIMVIYGRVGVNGDGTTRSAKCIHGGAAFIWPFLQSYQFLDLTPISFSIDPKDVLFNQDFHLKLPERYTIGISTNEEDMIKAAERFLGLPVKDIERLAEDIIIGQMRVVIETLDFEIKQNEFIEKICFNVSNEFSKIGLRIINIR